MMETANTVFDTGIIYEPLILRFGQSSAIEYFPTRTPQSYYYTTHIDALVIFSPSNGSYYHCPHIHPYSSFHWMEDHGDHPV